MKKEALTQAIYLGQMLRLLAPIADQSKSFEKRLSRLRSCLEEQVVLAVLSSGTVASRAETRIGDMADALRTSMLQYLDVPKLVELSRTPAQQISVYRLGKNGVRFDNYSHAMLGPVEAIERDRRLVPAGIGQKERARVVHAFTSAVKNTRWAQTLLRLSFDLNTAELENTHLMQQYSSHPGRTALLETLNTLCPDTATAGTTPAARRTRAKKLAVSAAGLFSTQVVLSAEALLAQADIVALVDACYSGTDASVTRMLQVAPAPTTVSRLLQQATTPTAVGSDETPEAVAQNLVNTLVAGLQAGKKAADEERAKLRKQADDVAKRSAVEALKQLNPKLLKVLQANPDLLKDA